MKLRINQRSKIFKMTFNHPINGILISTFCLAINKEDAEQTFRQEYSVEYPKNLKVNVQLLGPNDKKDSWKWYEFALHNKNQSILLSTNCLII